MKILTLIARILLGLMFVVFGLNGFFDFIPRPKELPPAHALEFAGALQATGYMKVVMSLQLVGGLLVLSGRFLPLGLLLLGPVIVNILLFHVFMDRNGLPIAIVVSALSLFLLARHWSAYASVFRPFRPASTNLPAGS